MQKMVKLNQGNLKVHTVNKLKGIIKRRKEQTVGYPIEINLSLFSKIFIKKRLTNSTFELNLVLNFNPLNQISHKTRHNNRT